MMSWSGLLLREDQLLHSVTIITLRTFPNEVSLSLHTKQGSN